MAKARKVVEKQIEGAALVEDTVTMAVAVDDSGYDPIYANYAQVAKSQFEFELHFARIPTKFSSDQLEAAKAGLGVSIPALAKVVLPFAVFSDLADLMAAQAKLWKDSQNVPTEN